MGRRDVMGTLTEIALFAGAGGGVWASRELGHRVVCYVEREPYCVEVLKARIDDGSFDDAPIWNDVTNFDGTKWRGLVDIISAGFPCQAFSVANSPRSERRQAQLFDLDPYQFDHRNRWPDTARIIGEVRPRLVFLENVGGLLGSHGYFGTVLNDLANLGYDAEWSVLSAGHVGAPHVRRRVWVVASLADADSERCEERRRAWAIEAELCAAKCGCKDAGSQWIAEPDVDRVVNGLANRRDRIKALGNGQVPQCAVAAFRGLIGRLPSERCAL